MSPASTGSVGARTAPRTTAAPSDSPITSWPNIATPAIVSGIAISSSRATPDQERRVKARSSFRPAPNRAMINASSLIRSISSASSTGSSQSMPISSIASAATAPSPR